MNQNDNDELERILDKYAEGYFNSVEGFGSTHTLTKEEALLALRQYVQTQLERVAKELLELERDYKSDEHEFDSGWNHGIWVAIDTIGDHLGEDEYAYQLGEKKRTQIGRKYE